MTAHLDESTLNDCADDSLSDAARPAAEAHLAACLACRAEVDRLRELRAALQGLPRDVAPPAHLRYHVLDSIAAPVPSPWYARPRRLAAAAIILVAASSATTALLVRGNGGAPVNPVPGHDDARPPGVVRPVGYAPDHSYEDAIAELQRAFRSQRHELAPATVRMIESSLALIDGALAEAREALAADPANAGLAELVRAGYERKLDVLRSATSHVRARS